MRPRRKAIDTSPKGASQVHYTESKIHANPWNKHPVHVRLIGYRHGDLFIPETRAVKRNVKTLLQGADITLSEFSRKGAGKIESNHGYLMSSLIRRMGAPQFTAFLAGYVMHGWKKYATTLLKKSEIKKGFAGRVYDFSSFTKSRWFRKMYREDPELVNAGIRLFITGRSLLMGAQILSTARYVRPSTKIAAEMGKAHLDEVHTFINRPRVGVRYADRVIAGLKKALRNEKVSRIERTELEGLIEEFENARRTYVIHA